MGPRAPAAMRVSEKDFFLKRDLDVLAVLARSVVGIAGAGGLGSNAAVSLARAGVGRLIVADFDVVEASDLNRQYYFLDQVGRPKVEALLENLKKANPYSAYETRRERLEASNVAAIFARADLLIEAVDEAATKQMIVDAWLAAFPDRPAIIASGLAGYGANETLRQRRLGNLYVIGDETTECDACTAPMAPRVAVVANMQANLAVELLMEKHVGRGGRNR